MNKLRSTYTTCRVMSISLVLLLVFGSVVVPALPLKSLDSSVEQSHLLLNYTQAGINLEKCSWTQKMCVVYYDRPLTALNDTFHRKCRITDYGSGPEVDVCSPFHKTTAFYRYECLNRGYVHMSVSCDTLWEDKSCNIPDITEDVSPCVQTSTTCPDPPPETNNTTYRNQSSTEPASTDHKTNWEVGFWCVLGILLLTLLVPVVLLVIINLKCSIGVGARRKVVECCEWIISKLKPDTQKMDNISDNNSAHSIDAGSSLSHLSSRASSNQTINTHATSNSGADAESAQSEDSEETGEESAAGISSGELDHYINDSKMEYHPLRKMLVALKEHYPNLTVKDLLEKVQNLSFNEEEGEQVGPEVNGGCNNADEGTAPNSQHEVQGSLIVHRKAEAQDRVHVGNQVSDLSGENVNINADKQAAAYTAATPDTGDTAPIAMKNTDEPISETPAAVDTSSIPAVSAPTRFGRSMSQPLGEENPEDTDYESIPDATESDKLLE